jgi:hypothetical protein
MNNQLMIERVLVAASKAETEGFANTSAAFKKLAELWDAPNPGQDCSDAEPPKADLPGHQLSIASHN